MLTPLLAILGGLVVLVWSSDRFVDGASSIANHLGVSPLVIGLTIVGFGTSAPEMVVSGFAAVQGNGGLGIGNAIGSNIANIALILGVTAVFSPLLIKSRILKIEMPILLAATLFAIALLWDGHLSQLDAALLVVTLVGILVWMVMDARRPHPHDALEIETELEIPTGMTMKQSVALFVFSLILLLISARVLVWGAVDVAQALGVSDLIIGLTIVAIGTSLPELAASIASARKNEQDIAIGNVIGSNLFNTLGVLAIPGMLSPGALPEDVLSRDIPVMAGLTLMLFFMIFHIKPEKYDINRRNGFVLLVAFIGYQAWLYYSVTAS